MSSDQNYGCFHIYTGTGKGKTTAAIGLAVRAAGAGLRVYIGEFIKFQEYSEVSILRDRFPEITIELFGNEGLCINGRDINDLDLETARDGYDRSLAALESGDYDLVILDEICTAVRIGALSEETALELVRRKPAGTELVFTGRDATEKMMEAADLVTDMREVKHYYSKGIPSRPGIDC